MRSADLTGFQWHDWPPDLRALPNLRCVYAFRLRPRPEGPAVFGRLRGESDLLFIGATRRLRDKLQGYLEPRHHAREGIRLHEFLSLRGYGPAVQLGYRPSDYPTQEERELLRRYEQEHHELPPWNEEPLP